MLKSPRKRKKHSTDSYVTNLSRLAAHQNTEIVTKPQQLFSLHFMWQASVHATHNYFWLSMCSEQCSSLCIQPLTIRWWYNYDSMLFWSFLQTNICRRSSLIPDRCDRLLLWCVMCWWGGVTVHKPTRTSKKRQTTTVMCALKTMLGLRPAMWPTAAAVMCLVLMRWSDIVIAAAVHWLL